MAVHVITAPVYDFPRGPTIFLAGPIQGAPLWQKDAIREIKEEYETQAKYLSRTPDLWVACPRRFEVTRIGEFTDQMYYEQVDWEHAYLDCAVRNGVVLFWLACEAEHACDRAYAQTTRFELGEHVERHRSSGAKLVVGIEPGFTNERYLRYTISKKYPNIPVYDVLHSTVWKALRDCFDP